MFGEVFGFRSVAIRGESGSYDGGAMARWCRGSVAIRGESGSYDRRINHHVSVFSVAIRGESGSYDLLTA